MVYALSVLYCVVPLLCFALLLLQPLFVHFINFLQLKTQVSSRSLARSLVSVSVQLLPSVEYQIHRMNASQAGQSQPGQAIRHTSSSTAAAAARVRRKRRHCSCVCVCVCLICACVFVHSFARYVSLACSLYVRKAEATQHSSHTHTHTALHAHSPRTCVSDSGNAFIVCVAEQKFCCSSLYEHTATAAAATASLWTVAGYT